MADKEQVIQALRATLISVKGALTIKQCNRDYRELQGEWIPFKKLGYSSLDKLFLDVPGFKVTQANGEWYVDAIASQETQHIAAMVSRQKSSKKAPKLSYPNRFPKKQGSWRKPSSGYVSNYNNQYSNQYYRAKGSTPFNNNTQHYKTNKYNSSKSNESKITANVKQTTKSANDHVDKVLKSSNSSQSLRESNNTHNEELKQPVRPNNDMDVKYSGKVSASQRLSNLRDRLNTVDLIPLQLPAANNECLESSGPVTNVVPAHNLEPPPDSTSSVEKLAWTCKKLGLPEPVYKVYEYKPKRGPVTFDCTVKVGGSYSVSSYPDSSPSEDLAKEVGAVKLLSAIESSEAGGKPTSSSSNAIVYLTELVSEHEAGLWAYIVPHLYSDLPPLQFPDDDFWNVFVTVANSTLEIWLRIIGSQYSDTFETLLAEMSKYYEHGGSPVDKSMLIKNAWYAVNLDDGGWQRAKILEIEEDSATVFLGDHGDDDVVYIHKIKILEPQFRKLPAQAILCRLEGAEELAASTLGAELVRRRLPGEVLVAAPGPRHDPTDPSVAVVLYDTSTQRDLNLNKEIVHDFCIAGAFTITQKPCEVEVGCVTEEGRVWVSRAGGAALVQGALALLTAGPYRRPLPAAPQAPAPNATTLYIVRTLAGDWVRCTIISGLDGEGTVRTQLVDSGLILRAPLSSLVPLQSFSPALNAFPPQAVSVRLGPAERAAAGMVARLRDLLLGARVLCRALPAGGAGGAPGDGNAPHVELGKLKEDEKDTTNHVEALHKKKERIFRSLSMAGEERPSSGSALPPPPLPAPGKCFDVYIAMAANPWNFVVQPNSTRHTLQTMMSSLQTECPKLTELDAPGNPVSGELYTVYYDKDASWYRYVQTHNVWPLHQDWTVEDCIRFQELCVEQQFVGICKDVGKDPLNPNEPLLTLDLIDTSTDEDIYINKQLVTEGRARLASTS
ncbi:hypothetical protein HF086_014815 [Spodoptera exigua]|uniref:HTH OST-type domain-containing protein n=1 Tax=Spodoptera exigua TaxID=7107 RepID=A0A922MH04_SPOEX|nr:hypothetical protein HF086_014815 [Spodoptera exigua]